MSKHISLASYELEAAARAEGYAHVCGVDEAGAGPLMGPVYAAAVILPDAGVTFVAVSGDFPYEGKAARHFRLDAMAQLTDAKRKEARRAAALSA